jgi:putative flavoprotein involved in K+ transport
LVRCKRLSAEPADRPPPLLLAAPARDLNLKRAGIRAVVWAAGFRPTYPWLKAPVLDEGGGIVHQGGITAVPGLSVLGLRFLRRRSSSFIVGCGSDAEELAPHIVADLTERRGVAA